MKKAIQLAKKLLALSKGGDGGEAKAAEHMLKRHMDKHGIHLDQLEDEIPKPYRVKFRKGKFSKMLMVQVIDKVMGELPTMYRIGRKCEFKFQCTASQYIEIEAMYDFYMAKYQEEIHRFNLGFISKNRIFSDSDSEGSESTLTQEEIMKIRKMMDGMESHSYHKQIEN